MKEKIETRLDLQWDNVRPLTETQTLELWKVLDMVGKIRQTKINELCDVLPNLR